jgi:cysteine desulfurase
MTTEKEHLYLDHASTTPVDRRVVESMLPYYTEFFANPSSSHVMGKKVKKDLQAARAHVASLINADLDEMVFTSGGTEASNLALGGAVEHLPRPAKILMSSVEHHATQKMCEKLVARGDAQVMYVKVNEYGELDQEDFKQQLQEFPDIISLIYANNELGTILDVEALFKIIHDFCSTSSSNYKPLIHLDACQALAWLDIDVKKLGIDMMTINASKINGPKGVGALWIRKGIQIKPTIVGGSQEYGLRAGTENVPSIIGFAKACELVAQERNTYDNRVRELRNEFWELLKKDLGDRVHLNGLPLDSTLRLPNNLNVSFADLRGEIFQLALSDAGIMCSTGSACSAHISGPSKVLVATGMSEEQANNSIRFSLGKNTTHDEIQKAANLIIDLYQKLGKLNSF